MRSDMTISHADAARARRAERGTISCVDPATLEALGEVAVVAPEDVPARVARARGAQTRWAEASFAVRRRVLGRVLDHVLDHADELCRVVVRDAGKTTPNAMLGEIWPVCEKLRWTMAHGERHLRREPMGSGLFPHKRAFVDYVPRGVVGAITAWNYPLQHILGCTIPPLMAGNAVVVKVSEWCAWSTARFQRIFDEALAAEGFSTDLVQLLDGYGETGQALVEGGVDMVIFIGSVENGRRVLAHSATRLIPVVLELGGKDAFIVCEDAHLEQAAHAAMAGAFIAAGQNCLAAERMFVHERVYAPFVDRLVALASSLRQGAAADEPVDVGAMTTPAQLETVRALVADAVAQGARVLVGGPDATTPAAGYFFPPTVLTEVTPEMAIMKEETFGPVATVMRVKSDDEAIAMANASQFGLGATVMTRSRRRAARIGRAIEAGGVSINDFGFTYMAQDLPFGGVKASGFGRLNGREGLRACTHPKAVLADRFPLHVPAKLFPVGRRDVGVARGAIRMLYGRGLRRKLQGARDLLPW